MHIMYFMCKSKPSSEKFLGIQSISSNFEVAKLYYIRGTQINPSFKQGISHKTCQTLDSKLSNLMFVQQVKLIQFGKDISTNQ